MNVCSNSSPAHEDAYLKSGFFEQLVEHAFISEVLQEAYFGSVSGVGDDGGFGGGFVWRDAIAE